MILAFYGNIIKNLVKRINVDLMDKMETQKTTRESQIVFDDKIGEYVDFDSYSITKKTFFLPNLIR